MNYIFSTTLSETFTDGLEMVKDELKKEGFGIFTELDVQAALKRNLNKDFQKYKVLGACNLFFAYQALKVEDQLGTILPCNIIVQEIRDGMVEISIVDPAASLQAIANPELGQIARKVQTKLKSVINQLSMTNNNNHVKRRLKCV